MAEEVILELVNYLVIQDYVDWVEFLQYFNRTKIH